MRKIYLTDNFNINMLSGNTTVKFMQITTYQANAILNNGILNYTGNKRMADFVSFMLNILIDEHVKSIKLTKNDVLIIAQYTGDKLPDLKTTLPEGETIQFWMLTL